jgi:hypothetical protein
MSTIRHSVQSHTWYAAAAAALAVGLVVVLMTSVFTRTSGSPPAPSVQIPVRAHGGVPYHAPCFVGHPGQPIELARGGCRKGTP